MPQRTYRFPGLITRFVLLSLAAVLLAVLRPGSRAEVRAEKTGRSAARRIAVSLSFATLFFAGAAFSAGAGDVVAGFVEQEAAATADQSPAEATTSDGAECARTRGRVGEGENLADGWDCTSETAAVDETTEAPAPEAPAEPVAVAPEAPEAPEASPSADQVEADPAAATTLIEQTENEVAAVRAGSTGHTAASRLRNAVRGQATRNGRPHRAAPRAKDDGAPPVLRTSTRRHTLAGKPNPEIDEPNTAATIWLQRSMPDPTPPSKRLTKRFARNLVYASHKHHVDWALVLGVLRARGYRGSVPATKAGLDRLARNLRRLGARRHQWSAVLALEGRTAFADRTIALARYHRAVGLEALVRGLEWAKPLLTKRLLNDKRVSIYGGGRGDLLAGRIDVRVIVLIRFLAEAHGQVTVSCLESGHRLFARPGVVSAHIYGLAVDIAALDGQSIMGHQQPGSVTEQAVRNMLLLPAEVRPVQVISLIGLGGPSFPLANHDDHIHAGF